MVKKNLVKKRNFVKTKKGILWKQKKKFCENKKNEILWKQKKKKFGQKLILSCQKTKFGQKFKFFANKKNV